VYQIVWEIVRQFVREIVLCVDALFSYRTENRIAIRFAANRTSIRLGNRMRVDGPLGKTTDKHGELFCFVCIRALSSHSAAEFNISPDRWQHLWLVAIVPPERWGKMDIND
jgi:hypothetical protein